jgi:hypothetical protein
MAAPSAWTIYANFKLNLGKKLENLSTDTIKMALFLSTSNVGSATVGTTYSAATNEVATAYGYTAAGVTCAATWTNSAGTETFTCANGAWTASGGSIVARLAVLYDSTSGDLIAYSTLDSTPADVTATTGNVLTVAISGSGVFTLA